MLKAGVALEEGQQCCSWMVWDGVQVVAQVHRLNKYTHGAKAPIAVYDFKTMYTCIPLDDLTDRMHKLICEVFVKRNQHVPGASGQPCLWLLQLSKSESKWVQNDQRKQNTRWVTYSGCRPSMFNVGKTGYSYIHQARQSCVMAKK